MAIAHAGIGSNHSYRTDADRERDYFPLQDDSGVGPALPFFNSRGAQGIVHHDPMSEDRRLSSRPKGVKRTYILNARIACTGPAELPLPPDDVAPGERNDGEQQFTDDKGRTWKMDYFGNLFRIA